MQKLWHFVIPLLLLKIFNWNFEYVFTFQRANYTIKGGNSKCFFFSELCPLSTFFFWHFAISFLLLKILTWNSEHVFTLQRATILSRETIQNAFFFPEPCTFSDLDFLSSIKQPITERRHPHAVLLSTPSYTPNIIECMQTNAFFNPISIILRLPVNLSVLPWSSFNRYYAQYILSKPLAAFSSNHCRNYYYQSSKGILAVGTEPATSPSHVLYATDWEMGPGTPDMYQSKYYHPVVYKEYTL